MTREELLALIDRAAADGWTELDLAGKGLTELPPEIGKLTQLIQLNLSSNKISEIPDAIANLSNLTELYLSRNKIREIPDAIANLSNLTELNLSYNQISKIPDAIASLSNLTELGLSDNKISEIPEIFIQFKKLKTIDVTNNPIANPPEEIADKGIHAIQAYFLNLKLAHYQNENTSTIERSIEFPPEYWTAGTSILSYFSHILTVKYPDKNIKVRIEQEGLLLRMIIDTPTGEIETIEKTLDEYAMVFTGQLPPESFLNDPFEIMALKNKLEITKLELRQAKELYEIASNKDRQRIDSLETQVNNLFSLIGHSLHRESKSNVPLTVNVPVNINNTDHLAQNTAHQYGQGDNVGSDKVGQDKIGRDKLQQN